MPKTRPYLYYDHVVSLCEHCLRRVEGKQVMIRFDGREHSTRHMRP